MFAGFQGHLVIVRTFRIHVETYTALTEDMRRLKDHFSPSILVFRPALQRDEV
jgi:hypothetical protein